MGGGGGGGGGGSRIFLKRRAPLRNAVTEKKASSQEGEGEHPLHPAPRSVPGMKYSSSFISFFMVLLTT